MQRLQEFYQAKRAQAHENETWTSALSSFSVGTAPLLIVLAILLAITLLNLGFVQDAHADEAPAQQTTYSVIYQGVYDSDGSPLAAVEMQFNQGDKVTYNAGVRDGYVFAGWKVVGTTGFNLPNSKSGSFTMPNHDVILEAQWQKAIAPASDESQANETNTNAKADDTKTTQKPPQQPGVYEEGIGSTTVRLNSVSLNTEGKAGVGRVEYGYAVDGGSVPETGAGKWQISTYFTGLTPGAKYTFYARFIGGVKDGVTYEAAISAPLEITTKTKAWYVTVEKGYGSRTGEGWYAPGDTVTINASWTGHVFRGWKAKVPDDLVINGKDKEKATFIMPEKSVTVEAIWSGTVSNKQQSSNALSTQLTGSGMDLAKQVFGENSANTDRVLDGDDVDIWVTATEDKKVSDKDKNLIAAAAGKNFTIANYLDILLYYQFKDDDDKQTSLTKTAAELSLSLSYAGLPTLKSGYKRSYKIIRLHDGKAVSLSGITVDSIYRTLAFKTDSFSLYALAYSDTKSSDSDDKDDSSNNNNNSSNKNDSSSTDRLNVNGTGSGSGSGGIGPSSTGDTQSHDELRNSLPFALAIPVFLAIAAIARRGRKEIC